MHMAYGRYNERVNGLYEPTNITGIQHHARDGPGILKTKGEI
jgi:hypothetical protein